MRQLAFGSLILLLVTFGWGKSSLGEQGAVPRGELRIVDNNPKNWAFLTLNIFEHLVEYDTEGTLVPRLATGWRWLNDRTLELTLRQGVTFHNGEGFDAAVVKLTWDEPSQLLQQHAVGAQFNFKPESRLEVIDAQTVRLVFPEPDGGALAKLSVTPMAHRQFYQELGWGTEFWCVVNWAGPWGTGPYRLVEGASTPNRRSPQLVFEAYRDYWDRTRLPRLHRIVFDNTLTQREAVELVKTSEGRVDLVTGLSPLETLRVAQSPFAKVVKNRGIRMSIFGVFNMRKAGSPWHDVRLRQAAHLAIKREDFLRYAAKGHGEMVPALLPAQGCGPDSALTPYPFAPDKARPLLREAGYPDGLAMTLIAPEDLEVQASVVSKMLEQGGCTVTLQLLNPRYL